MRHQSHLTYLPNESDCGFGAPAQISDKKRPMFILHCTLRFIRVGPAKTSKNVFFFRPCFSPGPARLWPALGPEVSHFGVKKNLIP